MPQMAKRHAAIGEASRFAEVHRYRSAESQGDNLLGQPGLRPNCLLITYGVTRYFSAVCRMRRAFSSTISTSITRIRRELVLSQQPERSVNQRLILFA